MASCSQCERESDNKHYMCPAKMSDGRAFTDYKPRCAVHTSLMSAGSSGSAQQPMNSYELRQYLINNAETLMERSRTEAERMNACGPCVEPWNQGTMLPEQSMVRCNASTCSVSTNDTSGLGQGRDYGISPDTNFVNRMEARDAKMRTQPSNCCTGYDDDIKYYPIGPAVMEEQRYAVPSGGFPFQV